MLSIIPSVLRGVNVRDLEKMKAIVREAYPSVPQLSTRKLHELRQGSASLVLVDVRSREEFDVSHLRSAVNLQSVEQIAEVVKERRAFNTVLYCSVGFRSTRIAQVLIERGVAGVMNLEGSIFQWANEGRPIYRGEVPVQEVHPYGKRWAGLLKPGLASASGHGKPSGD
jgi:rhodanese-related sulfurtransferase